MFADDTNLFVSDTGIENFFETMNEELRKVEIWFKANKLSLNVFKTIYSLLHSTRKILHFNQKRIRHKISWSILRRKYFPGSIILML